SLRGLLAPARAIQSPQARNSPSSSHRYASTRIAARNPMTGPSRLASPAARAAGMAPAAIRMTAAGTAATASGQPRGLATAQASRVQVARHVVGGHGLDDEPGAVGLERLADVPGRGQRVAHVVQAVEGGGQVVPGPGEGRRRGHLEVDPVGGALLTGVLAGHLDRLVVVIGPGEP